MGSQKGGACSPKWPRCENVIKSSLIFTVTARTSLFHRMLKSLKSSVFSPNKHQCPSYPPPSWSWPHLHWEFWHLIIVFLSVPNTLTILVDFNISRNVIHSLALVIQFLDFFSTSVTFTSPSQRNPTPWPALDLPGQHANSSTSEIDFVIPFSSQNPCTTTNLLAPYPPSHLFLTLPWSLVSWALWFSPTNYPLLDSQPMLLIPGSPWAWSALGITPLAC